MVETIIGTGSIKRVGLVSFPSFVFVTGPLADQQTVVARLGHGGFFRVYFGPGRRVELPDGTPWRITSVPVGGTIMPVVTCERGKLVEAAPMGNRAYGINGRDFAFRLYRTHTKGRGSGTAWLLREHDVEIASFGVTTVRAEHPVPLAAALVCFTAIRYGVPGEADMGIPSLQWR